MRVQHVLREAAWSRGLGATAVKDLHELEVDVSLSLASTAEAFVAAAVVVVV